MVDQRRVYFDHEPAYRKIVAKGGSGWDDLNGDSTDSYAALEQFLASRWAPATGARVLEIGCGGGQAALRMARAGCRVHGIDFSETAIELARANARAAGIDARFEVASALALGAIGPFELVVDNHLLHCLIGDDRVAALREARRVLVPGGVIFVDTMSCEGDFDPVRHDIDPVTRIISSHSRFWASRRELEQELAAAGFTIELIETRKSDPGIGDMIVVYARA